MLCSSLGVTNWLPNTNWSTLKRCIQEKLYQLSTLHVPKV